MLDGNPVFLCLSDRNGRSGADSPPEASTTSIHFTIVFDDQTLCKLADQLSEGFDLRLT